VALHGLGGGCDSTWSHPQGANWLKDFIKEDVPDVRIMTYGYNASLRGGASKHRPSEYAHTLLGLLDDVRLKTGGVVCDS
jgi:hypothetical protein